MISHGNAALIWVMQVDFVDADILARWQGVLGPDEIACSARCFSAAHRKTYIAAHALMRALLEAIGGRPARDWQFRTSDSGKLEAVGQADSAVPRFSLTHTDSLVACAASKTFFLGIDAEPRRRRIAAEVMDTTLAPSERDLVRAMPADKRDEAFLRLWTLREAYVKAAGGGLNFPNEEFAFQLDPLNILFTDGVARQETREWQLFNWSIEQHILSLATHCHEGRPITIVQRIMAPNELTFITIAKCDATQRVADRHATPNQG
jgi:4'-phosphopantetheinyl transferase